MTELQRGDFVCVKSTNDYRPGQDAMVWWDGTDPACLELIFGHDRHNQPQSTASVGIEAWCLDELDLATIERARTEPVLPF